MNELRNGPPARLVGLTALAFSALYPRILPGWTAIALMAGVVLVSLSQNLPEGLQVLAAGVRDLGFAGMGAALLRAGTVSGRRLDPVPADEIPLHRQAAHPIAPPLAASKK